MIQKEIRYFGQQCTLACDAKCNKAWGINNRPAEHFDEDEYDDFAYLADDELGEAPVDPGIYEGGYGKPQNESQRLNKWCARECERSTIADPGEEIELPDFSKRLYNQPWKHEEANS